MKGVKVTPTSWRVWVHPMEIDPFFLNAGFLELDFLAKRAIITGLSMLPDETLILDVEVIG